MVTGLPKLAGQRVRQRASSPKLQVLNTALIAAQSSLSFSEAQQDRNFWGRLIEPTVGAHLANSVVDTSMELFYWERGKEVDFVLRRGQRVVAIEVKSGRGRENLPGMSAFDRAFAPQRKLLVGGQGLALDEFLLTPVTHWLE